MGQKHIGTQLEPCVFYFVLICTCFWLNVNMYTFFLAISEQKTIVRWCMLVYIAHEGRECVLSETILIRPFCLS